MLPGRTYTPLDFAMMAWRRRWIIVGGLFLGAYAALIVSSRLHDMYQSEMLIQVVPQRVPDEFVRSTVTMRTEDRLNTLTQQVLSRTALEALIRDMNLYEQDLVKQPLQDVIEAMRASIKVVPVIGNGTDAFYVRFSYTDPIVATRVTERVGGLFIAMNARDRGDLAQETDEFLQSQLSENRSKLEEQEQKLEKFRQENAGRLPTQTTFNMQAMQNTQMAIQALVESLARDRDRRMMQERLYNDAVNEPVPQDASLTASPRAPDGKAPDGDQLAGLTTQQQLAAARENLSRLQLRLRPEHPDIARTERLVQTLEDRLAREAKATPDTATNTTAPTNPAPTAAQAARRDRIAGMRAELDSLDRQIAFKEAEEQRQRAILVEYQRRIEAVPGVESQWVALTRDYDTQQTAYKELLSKAEHSKVAVQLERRQIGEQFRVIDPATPPIRPTGLRRLQLNGLGALAGLGLGIVIAAFLEIRDTSFRSSDDISQVLKLPVIAMVPYVMIDQDRLVARRRRILTSVAVAVVVLGAAVGFWSLQLWKHLV